MAQAAEYVNKIDQAAVIVEEVSANLRDLLGMMRSLALVKQDAYDAVYLLRRDLGRAVAILDGGYPTPRTSIFHEEERKPENVIHEAMMGYPEQAQKTVATNDEGS